jgi:HEPN domain-containing protein
MKTNRDLARLLVRKAESDLATAQRALESDGPYDTGLFHCQQAVEKYLKALLAAHDTEYPKIHDVTELAALSVDFCPPLETLPFPIAEFNPFAVTIRYDDWDEDISGELLAEILADTMQVLAAVQAALPEEIRPSRKTGAAREEDTSES